jgi:uncharacterized protein YfaP (DUF2135 family)
MSLRITALTLLAALAGVPVAQAKRVKPTPCSGRYVVEGERLFGGGTVPADAIIVSGRQIALDSGCGPVTGKVRATRKFTIVSATFKACNGLVGRGTLQAKIDMAGCTVAKGRFRAKKSNVKRRFTAKIGGAPVFTRAPLTTAPITGATIGPAGGMITVGDSGHPLAGLVIEVPPGATTESIVFNVEYADVSGAVGLPAGATPSSKIVRITTTGSDDWNRFRMFERPVRVTLPYAPPQEGEDSVAFYIIRPDGMLEAAGQDGPTDMTQHRISFFTRTFADTAISQISSASLAPRPASIGARLVYAEYIAIGVGNLLAASLTGSRTIDSGFRPSVNGWFIPNYGSYYNFSRGGSCFGFVGAAKHFHSRRFAPLLYVNYRDAQNTTSWIDDAVAIEYTSRVHNGLSAIWTDFWNEEITLQRDSAIGVVRSILGGLYVTGAPVLIYIKRDLVIGGVAQPTGAHAISFYRADIAGNVVTFHVYDPNFPGADTRRVVFTIGTGFTNYASGTTAADSAFQYNYFKHVGFYVGMTTTQLDAIKEAADQGFKDASLFPAITVTEIVGKNTGEPATEGTTAGGDHKWITSDDVVVVRGTVLGGLSQTACCVVNSAYVLVGNRRFPAAVNNATGSGDGKFEVTVPVEQGENEFAIIAASPTSIYSQWAGFYRNVLESTHSAAALTVTLSWVNDASDVDLYVQEPTAGGKSGDTVYYRHRRGASTDHPYLDFDNTRGFGPEHYVAKDGMTTLYADATPATGLYGDYTVKAHYYADHDADPEEYQPIGFDLAWRYLAYCPTPCTNPATDGLWLDGGASGLLSAASSSNCCSISNAGADWSDAFTINYPEPDPADYVAPPSHAVMLP